MCWFGPSTGMASTLLNLGTSFCLKSISLGNLVHLRMKLWSHCERRFGVSMFQTKWNIWSGELAKTLYPLKQTWSAVKSLPQAPVIGVKCTKKMLCMLCCTVQTWSLYGAHSQSGTMARPMRAPPFLTCLISFLQETKSQSYLQQWLNTWQSVGVCPGTVDGVWNYQRAIFTPSWTHNNALDNTWC